MFSTSKREIKLLLLSLSHPHINASCKKDINALKGKSRRVSILFLCVKFQGSDPWSAHAKDTPPWNVWKWINETLGGHRRMKRAVWDTSHRDRSERKVAPWSICRCAVKYAHLVSFSENFWLRSSVKSRKLNFFCYFDENLMFYLLKK